MSHVYWSAPRIWPGETIAIIGGGPSLTQQQVDACKGKCRVIAINDSLRLAPWCDVHYFCDEKWWNWHHEKDWYKGFTGLRVTLENPKLCALADIKSLRNLGVGGLSENPEGVHTGQNSGYQCMNLALHLGAARILLLGVDMGELEVNGQKRNHWFGDHPDPTGMGIYQMMIRHYEKAGEAIAAKGILVLNCSATSALECFKKETVESALLDPHEPALPT